MTIFKKRPNAQPIIFWGASGHAKVLYDFIGLFRYRLVALFDNDQKASSPFQNVPIFHGPAGFQKWLASHPAKKLSGLVAIGGSKGAVRLEIHEFFLKHGIEPAVVIHPNAFVAENAKLGPGTQILANAAVCVEARLGRECIVNTAASVDHECELGDGVHIGPGAVLAGCVRVGRCSFIGAGAIILPRVSIGQNVIVGAGAVVTRDLPDNVLAYGNPARVQRKSNDAKS
jgi:sugar O-acyltransferase (sialic acid O-acetyltransferase NeuD family)